MQPSGWHAHGHHRDNHYDDVVLHVVWTNPQGATDLPPGVPVCALQEQLDRPLPEILDTVEPATYPYARQVAPGELATTLAQYGDDELAALLTSYGLARLLRKACSFSAEIGRCGVEQTVYRAICCGLGYKNNEAPFAALAEALPLAELAELSDTGLAGVLFGVAGLLPDPTCQPVTPELLQWVRGLWTAWGPLCTGHQGITWSRRPAVSRQQRRSR
jgi:hypothetical protein